MRILLTGATGFVGRRVAHRLLSEGHEILIISRRSREDAPQELATASGSINWVVGELSDIDIYRSRIKDFCPDVVVHLAWEGIPDFSFTRSLGNLQDSLGLFDLLLSLSCKHFVIAGTCLEVGKKYGPCPEGHCGSPVDDFTWAKHSLREWLSLRAGGVGQPSFAWLRLFYVYGPNQRLGSLIPTILNDMIAGRKPNIRQPGNRNDFIFVDDVAEALTIAALQPNVSGVYNVGSGFSTSVAEVCSMASDIIGNDTTISCDIREKAAVDFWAEINRIQTDFGWKPKTNLRLGIEATLKALRESAV